ncbi:MAG: hypothetical protein DME26_01310 [Verrucomicrobia bacterium]|nr:MAG: hypothetical protein DME26_01310 [Verrucomicrobiota bacterium]
MDLVIPEGVSFWKGSATFSSKCGISRWEQSGEQEFFFANEGKTRRDVRILSEWSAAFTPLQCWSVGGLKILRRPAVLR